MRATNLQGLIVRSMLFLLNRVVDLIYEAVSIGQSATEMTTRLFVDIKKLCAELKVPADRRNARFFPSADVIRRVAAKQLTKLRAHQVSMVSKILGGG